MPDYYSALGESMGKAIDYGKSANILGNKAQAWWVKREYKKRKIHDIIDTISSGVRFASSLYDVYHSNLMVIKEAESLGFKTDTNAFESIFGNLSFSKDGNEYSRADMEYFLQRKKFENMESIFNQNTAIDIPSKEAPITNEVK